MLETKFPKVTLSTGAAFDAIASLTWLGPVADELSDSDLGRLRRVSKSLRYDMSSFVKKISRV